MRVFLTGATGFIGSHLTRLLVQQGCTVAVLVRPGADRGRLADVAGRLTIIEGDLDATHSFAGRLKAAAPDVCVHLAWCATESYLHSAENIRHVTNSLVLWQVLADAGCRRVVLAGTCVEYDSTLGYFAEDSVIRPRTLYAASKHALWLMTEQFERGVGSSAVTARLFQIYGPGEHPDRLVSRVIRALLANKPCLLTEGRQLRDYLHVEDVARALWEISRSDIEGPINVGSASPVSVAAVAREIGHLLNRAELLNLGGLPARPDDPACLCARPGPLHGRLGWTPRYDLRTGLQYTIDWWKRHMRDAVVLPAM